MVAFVIVSFELLPFESRETSSKSMNTIRLCKKAWAIQVLIIDLYQSSLISTCKSTTYEFTLLFEELGKNEDSFQRMEHTLHKQLV